MWVLSIHDKSPPGYICIDIRDILLCLGSTISDYLWCVSSFDSTGESLELGVPLTTDDLLKALESTGQTVDGAIVGLPSNLYSERQLHCLLEITRFPTTQGQIAILAVDSTYFEVLTKNEVHVQLIEACFHDVRYENPDNYF